MQERFLKAKASISRLVWARRLDVAWLLAAVASSLATRLLGWAVARKVTDLAA